MLDYGRIERERQWLCIEASSHSVIPTAENSLGGSIRLWTGIYRNDHGNHWGFS